MKHAPTWLALCSLALTTLGGLSLARAEEEFPREMRGDLQLSYDVPCSVCHIKGNTAASTPIMPFALSLRARGLTGGGSALRTALTRAETDQVDSDGDGQTDIAELKAATDPNSSANADISTTPEPGFGCGGSAPHGEGGAAMGILGFGFLALRRRRGPRVSPLGSEP